MTIRYNEVIESMEENREAVKLEKKFGEPKTRDQRVIEAMITGGKVIDGVITEARGYTRLPSGEPIFMSGDSLQAWLYFAEKRDKFNQSLYSGYIYQGDRPYIFDFFKGINNYKDRQKIWREFAGKSSREVEQVSSPLYKID